MAFLLSAPHSLTSLMLSLLLFVLHAAVMARAITRADRTPASRVAWVAAIALLPLAGVIAYLFLGETSIGRGRVRRMRDTLERMPEPPDASAAPDIAPRFLPLFQLAASINGLPALTGNRITLLGDPDAPPDRPTLDSDASIDALVRDIALARESVHLCFYIWLDDDNGGKVADALCTAARRGVQCRAMVDALGSRAFVHSPRWRQLRAAGVHVLATLDDIPRLGHLAVGRLDLRNHRKIVVVDNHIAYCGSQNCADPAFRVAPRFAPWIDILLRCEGPIARQAQYIFLSAWIAETGESLDALPSALPAPEIFAPGATAQMFGTGPASHGNAMSDMFVAALYAAREELIITTPYFVPDEAIIRAMCAAPRRGVKTTLVVPKRNNSFLVASAGRSIYDDLLASGVALFEYPLGLLHTKSLTIDGEVALVGSANIDRRSLQLNFENNLLLADAATAQVIRQRQQGYLSVSTPVHIDAVRAWPFHQRLLQDAIGMMAPLL